jgi:hypothetical protein
MENGRELRTKVGFEIRVTRTERLRTPKEK